MFYSDKYQIWGVGQGCAQGVVRGGADAGFKQRGLKLGFISGFVKRGVGGDGLQPLPQRAASSLGRQLRVELV
jgi:hypothetical protein